MRSKRGDVGEMRGRKRSEGEGWWGEILWMRCGKEGLKNEGEVDRVERREKRGEQRRGRMGIREQMIRVRKRLERYKGVL
jgi:hypothetical protein